MTCYVSSGTLNSTHWDIVTSSLVTVNCTAWRYYIEWQVYDRQWAVVTAVQQPVGCYIDGVSMDYFSNMLCALLNLILLRICSWCVLWLWPTGFKADRALHSGTEQYNLHPTRSTSGGPNRARTASRILCWLRWHLVIWKIVFRVCGSVWKPIVEIQLL